MLVPKVQFFFPHSDFYRPQHCSRCKIDHSQARGRRSMWLLSPLLVELGPLYQSLAWPKSTLRKRDRSLPSDGSPCARCMQFPLGSSSSALHTVMCRFLLAWVAVTAPIIMTLALFSLMAELRVGDRSTSIVVIRFFSCCKEYSLRSQSRNRT